MTNLPSTAFDADGPFSAGGGGGREVEAVWRTIEACRRLIPCVLREEREGRCACLPVHVREARIGATST